MKKFYTLFIILSFLGTRSNAQYADVSLDFMTIIQSVYPTQSAGIFNGIIQMDTTAAFVRTLRYMDIHSLDSSHPLYLNGLQYFDSLRYLNCAGNSIERFEALPPMLDTLICSDQLWEGWMHWTTLATLPTLPVTLKYLDCNMNDLTSLPLLPQGLTWLDCSYQYYHVSSGDIIWEAVELPPLPSSLRYLKGTISNNNFTELPLSLLDMRISAANMTQLPGLPPSLAFLSVAAPLNCIPVLPASMGASSPYNALPYNPPVSYNLYLGGTNITCIPNDVPGMVQYSPFPVCNGSNNPNGCPSLPVFAAAPSISGLISVPGFASNTGVYTLYGYNFSTASGNITITPSSSLEVSTDNINYSTSPLNIPYSNGNITMQVYVRISSSASTGTITGMITNSLAGMTDAVITVNGLVSTPFIAAGPAITGLNSFVSEVSEPALYTIMGMGLTPAAGNISITPSAGLEVSTDNVSFSGSTSLSYSNGLLDTAHIYVRMSNTVPIGAFTGTVTNSGGAVANAVVQVTGTVYATGVVAGPDVTGLSTTVGMPSPYSSYGWEAVHVTPNIGTTTITASPGFEVADWSGNYASSISVGYESDIGDWIRVRISSTAPAGPVTGTVTHSIAGYPDAIVNVSGYVHGPLINAGPSISGLTTITGTASIADTYTLSAIDLNPASGSIILAASANLELSTDNVNFSASVTIPYASTALASMQVYVRIGAGAPAGAINGTITNSGGGAADVVVSVSGNVSSTMSPVITAGPDISGLSASSGSPSTAGTYVLSASDLIPASGSITITVSSFLEVSTDNINFSSSPLLVPYSGGNLPATTIYVRMSGSAPSGTFSGTVTNSGGGAASAVVSVGGTMARPATVTIGPNPARNSVTVYLPGNVSTVSINIVNDQGKLVRSGTTNSESVQINLHNLSRGIYTIRIKGENIDEGRKVMVE